MEPAHQTILRRLIISSGFRAFSLVLSMGIGFFMTPFVIGVLGKEDNGLFVLVGSVVGSLALLEMGLNTAVSRNIAVSIGTKDNKALNEFYNSGFFLFSGIGVLCFLVSIVIACGATTFFPDLEKVSIFSIMVIVVGAQFAINLPLRAFNGLLTGSMRQDLSSLITLSFKLIGTAATVVVLLLGGRLIALVFAGLTVTIFNAIVWYLVSKATVPQAKINFRCVKRQTVGQLYGYSFYSFITQISKLCQSRLSVFAITCFLGLGAVTVYDIAFTLVSYYGMVVMLTVNILSPVFATLVAQKKMETVKKALRFSLKVTVIISVFVAFGMIAWGLPFLLRWMGEEFRGAYLPLVLLSIASLVEFSQAPAVEYLYGTAKHHYHSLTCTIEAVLLLVLCFPLTWAYGLVGTATSILIAAVVVRCFIQPYYICKVVEISHLDYLLTLGRPLLFSTLALVPGSVFTYFFVESSYLQLVLVGAVSALSFFPIAIFCVFSREEREMVLQAMFKRTKKQDVNPV